MSKAFRCDICEGFFDKYPNTQVVSMGFNWHPEVNEDKMPKKIFDMCEYCSENYSNLFRQFRDDMIEYRMKRDTKKMLR